MLRLARPTTSRWSSLLGHISSCQTVPVLFSRALFSFQFWKFCRFCVWRRAIISFRKWDCLYFFHLSRASSRLTRDDDHDLCFEQFLFPSTSIVKLRVGCELSVLEGLQCCCFFSYRVCQRNSIIISTTLCLRDNVEYRRNMLYAFLMWPWGKSSMNPKKLISVSWKGDPFGGTKELLGWLMWSVKDLGIFPLYDSHCYGLKKNTYTKS